MHKLVSNSKESSKHCESSKRKASDIYSVSTVVGIIFVGLLLILYGVIYLTDGILPTALHIANEKENPDAFIAERAQEDLKLLTHIGPRVVGSYENEMLAVKFLVEKIDLIQQQVHHNQKIELDLQTVSGFYKRGHGTTVYANLQNIVVKFHSKNNSNHSLLINAHFDSASTSPGGSDDGINCAVMLEVLRKLSRSPETFQHNIIFLFNGAEETGLHAAHGFISQHKWAKEVRAVVNLDSAGTGGRIMLVQVGPEQPWLLNYYKKVRHPNAQVFVEEIFQSGFIPSDDDFTIFKQFGVVGLDFIFVRDGYRYHTKFDGVSNIPPGSFQYVGDSALFVIRNLANAPELSKLHEQPRYRTVYYDFLGLFMICYTEDVAIIIHNITAVLSLTITMKSFHDFGLGFSSNTPTYHIMAFGAILLGWTAAALSVAIIAFGIDGLDFSMSWYNRPWIILGLYVTPAFICSCGFIAGLNIFILRATKTNLSISAQAQIQAHLLRLTWTFLLIIGTLFGIRSVYLILIPVLFQTVTFATIQILCLQHSPSKWQIVYVFGMIIPTIFSMQQTLTVATIIVPVFGRTGSSKNPELYIGAFAVISTLLITSFYTPLITLVRKPSILLAVLSGVFIMFIVTVFTPLGFPYSSDSDSPAPQRLMVAYEWHTNETDQQSGFRIWCQDRNSYKTVENYVKDLDSKLSGPVDAPVDDSIWIPAKEPVIDNKNQITLKLNSKINITNSLTRFDFTASGPSQMTIRILAKDVLIAAFNSLSPLYTVNLNNTSFYSIGYIWAKRKTPLTFSLDFVTPAGWTEQMFTIELSGNYYYVKDKQSKAMQDYTDFLNQFPKWVEIEADVRTSKSWDY